MFQTQCKAEFVVILLCESPRIENLRFVVETMLAYV